MISSSDHPVIAVATSIPPRLVRQDAGHSLDDVYQRLCIRSWIDSGFRILSVNDREEIPDLAALYPEVNFVATNRNASAWTGRKNPYIADLLLALKDAPEPVLGIINADLVFEPSPAWRTRLPSLVGEAMVVVQRYEATSLLQGAFRRYYGGFDCFFFDRTIAHEALEHAMPFAMGVPWWDYWLPCVAVLNNRHILVVDRPSVVHLAHRLTYAGAVFREFGHIFADFVIGRFESVSQALPEIITTIVPLCREIAASPRKHVIDSREYGRKLLTLCDAFVQPMCKNVVRFELNSLLASDTHSSASADSLDPSAAFGSTLTVDNVFRRFDRRLAAGEAQLQAKKMLDENRLMGP